uniref:Uncharacterized protein n=1 Tax=Anguilla anguilla TaxID=7936 RepID=A0A0E9S6A7_ANGAN
MNQQGQQVTGKACAISTAMNQRSDIPERNPLPAKQAGLRKYPIRLFPLEEVLY